MYNNDKIRVLIADNDVDFCFICTTQISLFDDITCCGVAHDGKDAVQKIQDTLPDVVVINVALPIIDGLGVIEHVKQDDFSNSPKFIVLCSTYQSSLVNLMLEKGASYYLFKPCNVNTFVSRIKLVAEENSKKSNRAKTFTEYEYDEMLKKDISKLIMEFGFSTKLIGFEYIQNLMFLMIKSKSTRPTLLQVYKLTAEKYDTDSRCVENAVCGAIKSAMRNKTQAMEQLLSLAYNNSPTSLSNGKFLTLAVQSMKLG